MPQKYRLSIMIIVAACSALATAGLWASTAIYSQDTTPRIVNKTSALQVVGAEISSVRPVPTMELILSNTSNMNIRAYTISMGHSWITRDYAFSTEFLRPGEVREQEIPIGSIEGGEIVISAVYFEDGTGDGDPRYVNMLRGRSSAFRDQTRRIIPRLNRLLNSGQLITEDALVTLESEISRLPRGDENLAHSPDYQSGLDLFRETLANRVRALRDSEQLANQSVLRGRLNDTVRAIRFLER